MAMFRFGVDDQITIADGVYVEHSGKKPNRSGRVEAGRERFFVSHGRAVQVVPPLRPAYKLVLYVWEDGTEDVWRIPIIAWQVSLDIVQNDLGETWEPEPITMEEDGRADQPNSHSVIICDDYWWDPYISDGMGEESAMKHLRDMVASNMESERKRKEKKEAKG